MFYALDQLQVSYCHQCSGGGQYACVDAEADDRTGIRKLHGNPGISWKIKQKWSSIVT